MSGDDPNTTDKNEGWDVFYGGWPQFGDLLAWNFVQIGTHNALSNIYDYSKLSSTTGEAVYSNFGIATLGASAKLTKQLFADLSYSKLTFDNTYAGVDDDFGDYYQAKIKYQYSKPLSFSIYAALLDPGKAFTDNPNQTGMNDNATEVFWETMVKF